MRLATSPTATSPLQITTLLVSLITATTEGSEMMMPSPRAQTSVLAVPRSMPRSFESIPNRPSKIMSRPLFHPSRCSGLCFGYYRQYQHRGADKRGARMRSVLPTRAALHSKKKRTWLLAMPAQNEKLKALLFVGFFRWFGVSLFRRFSVVFFRLIGFGRFGLGGFFLGFLNGR